MSATWKSSDSKVIVTVESTGDWTNDRWPRPRYRWTVTMGEHEWSDDDLSGPAIGSEPPETSMLRTLAGFMGAWKEALDYEARRDAGKSGNADLFPADMRDVAEYADEFACDVGAYED